MKKSLKVFQVAEAYQLIEGADYLKLTDEDKVRLWKISRVLKPTAAKFLGDKEDAIKSFVTPEFVEAFKKLRLHEVEQKKGEESSLTPEEYKECSDTVLHTNSLMEKAIGKHADKEVEIEFEPLSEDALGTLITSNGWEFSKAEVLDWLTAKEV